MPACEFVVHTRTTFPDSMHCSPPDHDAGHLQVTTAKKSSPTAKSDGASTSHRLDGHNEEMNVANAVTRTTIVWNVVRFDASLSLRNCGPDIIS